MLHFKNIAVYPAAFVAASILLAASALLAFASDATVSISPSSATYLPGDTVTYTVTLTNDDPSETLTNLTYKFTVEDTVAVITGATLSPSSAGTDNDGNFIQSAAPQSLPPGASASFDVTVSLPADFSPDTLRATAAIFDDQGFTVDDRSAAIHLFAPRLVLSLSGPVATPRNATLEYILTATNTGYAPANNILVTDTIPGHLTFLSAPGSADCGPSTGSNGAAIVACGPFNLDSKQQRTITLDFVVDAVVPCSSFITNAAEASVDALPKVSASVTTVVLCPTPTPAPTLSPTPSPSPSPSSKPAPTPTPQIIYVTAPASSSSDDNNNKSSSSGSAEPLSVPKAGKVKAARTPVRTSHQGQAGYIQSKLAPLVVERVFKIVHGRKPSIAESSYWKSRARSDKDTTALLYNTMLWHRGRGLTYVKPPVRPAIAPPNRR